MKQLHMIAFLLMFVGALNWGLVGLFGFNLVTFLLGAWPMLVNVIYVLVGLSAIYVMATHRGDCKVCGMPEKKMAAMKPAKTKKRK